MRDVAATPITVVDDDVGSSSSDEESDDDGDGSIDQVQSQ